jgi:hypothetical protein
LDYDEESIGEHDLEKADKGKKCPESKGTGVQL